jgi:hypothetical protein
MPVSSTAQINITVTDQQAAGLATAATAQHQSQNTISFTDGAGANQVNQAYSAKDFTVGGGGSDNFDLNGTALKDAFGNNLALVRVKEFVLRAAPTNTADIVVGGTVTNEWTGMLSSGGTIKVKPGGVLAMIAPDATGFPVTATTNDILKIAGTAGNKYDILIAGSKT